MNKVFWQDPYQTTLQTKVVSVDGNKILLQDTIIFSFSGGQESDKAWINDILIVGSEILGNLIYYFLPDNNGIIQDQVVFCKIDWPRRHRLMRLHFAAELILEIVTQKYKLEKIGANISENKSRIDFLCDKNISTYFEAILVDYDEIIKKNFVIHKGYDDLKNQRRYWKIDGFAKVSCGGTHVDKTSEVGFVDLKRSHPGKKIERIEIYLKNE